MKLYTVFLSHFVYFCATERSHWQHFSLMQTILAFTFFLKSETCNFFLWMSCFPAPVRKLWTSLLLLADKDKRNGHFAFELKQSPHEWHHSNRGEWNKKMNNMIKLLNMFHGSTVLTLIVLFFNQFLPFKSNWFVPQGRGSHFDTAHKLFNNRLLVIFWHCLSLCHTHATGCHTFAFKRQWSIVSEQHLCCKIIISEERKGIVWEQDSPAKHPGVFVLSNSL